MKLLRDQNLSFKLCGRLAGIYPMAVHVRDIGMETASDQQIWDYARAHGYTIVSKDEDFHQRSFLYGAPPKIIWLRLGNCTTGQIEQVLRSGQAMIEQFLVDKEGAFLALESGDD